MGDDNIFDKKGRVRPPRVHIRYDVETEGARVVVDLPFVVGVMADLSGHRKEPLKSLKNREAQEIDRDNFNQVMADASPRLAMRVNNKLTEDNAVMGVELNFNNLDDFAPHRVAEQVEPLRKLLETRKNLEEMLSKMDVKQEFSDLLNNILNDAEQLATLSSQAAAKPPDAPAS